MIADHVPALRAPRSVRSTRGAERRSCTVERISRRHERRTNRDARDDALAAGFFDALIGNQDRHVGQFRYDEPNRVLGLLDHGFSFPVEGAYCRGAYFQQFRRREHVRVTDEEREALTRLVDDPEILGLAGVLEPDRAERLRWRAQRMLDLGVVLLKGVV
jgi:hypothetical protein